MEKDLELLEQAFLLLGIAQSDEQLEKIVGKFLCPVILKMSSEHKPVQKKVMELLTHVSNRLNSRPNIQLPMKPLMEILQDPSSVQVVKNFSLIYYKMGFSRLTPPCQVDLLPTLIGSLEGKSSQQMDSLLQMYSPALVHLSFPVQPNKLATLLPPKESHHLRSFVLEFLLYFILMPYSHKGKLPPPGLSHTQVKRATGDKQLEPDLLEKLKLSILKLLFSGECGTNEITCHVVIGMSDTRHSVNDYSENQWRQLSGTSDYEHPAAVKMLLHIFLGSTGKVLKADSNELQSPGSLRYRISTMKYFNRSAYAANSFPFCIQVVFESLFGIVTNTILRTLTMEFILHIVHSATQAKLQLMSPLLITALNKIFDLPESKEEKKILLLAYTCLGLVAKCSPQLFRKDPKHVLKLMEALRNVSDRETRLSVQECLSVVAKSYIGITGDNVVILEAMLLDNITHREVHARWGAAYCSRIIFPFSHVPSRYVSLLACGDEREEVREEGKKGLLPNQDNPDEEKHFPGFEPMMQYVYTRAKANMEGNGMCYTVASGKLPYRPPTLSSLLKFLHQCLLFSAKCGATDSIVLNNSDLTVPLDRASIARLREYLSTLCQQHKEEDRLNHYLAIIKYALSPAADSDLHGVALNALLHTLLASPPHVERLFLPELDHVKTFTQSTNSQTRESAARLVSHLVSLLPQEEAIAFVRNVLNNTHSAVYTIQHGSLVTLGYLGAICNKQLQSSTNSTELTGIVHQSLGRIVDFLLESSIHVVRYACSALGEIVRSGPFPEGGTIDVKLVIDRLRKLIKNSTDIHLKERCVSSLGLLCIGDTRCPHKELILQTLFSLKENKHIDLQFTVGEALSCVAAGQYCQSANDPWDYNNANGGGGVKGTELGHNNDVMDSTLKSLLEEFAFSSAPIVRQSACIWMLSVLQNISKHPSIQDYLKRFQMGFVNLLADSNDMIQEVASRGLVLVYELSDPTQKESLVSILVGTLMEGRKGIHPISKDSKVFTEGTLGKTPTGSALTTYKELCSLASDLNQPDLIYKFMHLANHHALWNSKKGAAFGMTTIASHAKDQLVPYLPTLVPRLFRYKYDPIPRIQLSMSNIWEAIVTDTKKTIELYYSEIVSDLISNLGSNQWRNREASCLALRDLLVVYQSAKVSDYLATLWELSLRVRDDIKETVRKAADPLCKSLLKVTIKLCESEGSTKTGSVAIQSVLPVLLKTGMTNPAQEVRAISLLGIVKIAEKAGPMLKPHIPQLVPFLLESMSSLEPQILNTWSLQLADESGIQEQLETIRVAASKTSPMMKACDLCIPHVDPDVLTELVPQLVGVLKSGVGLGTKVGCAQFLISVVQSKTDYLTPHAGKLLSALLSGLSDRSATVRKGYAKAIGHIVKVTKENSVSKLVQRLKKMYYESGDSNVQSSVAHTIYSMAQYSPDSTKNVTVDLVPLVFVAIHGTVKEEDDASQDTIKLWNEVWQELVPNTSAGVRLYLNELMEQICPDMSAQSWEIKRTAANSLSTIAEKIGPALGPPHLATMLHVLLDGLQGRIWNGKETLMKSLKTVCESCSTAVRDRKDKNQPDGSEILSCLYTQCKKNDLHYKLVAIETTGQVMSSLEADGFKQFYDILLPLLTTEESSQKMEVDKQQIEIEEEREKKSQLLELQVSIFQAIGLSWPPSSCGESQRESFREVWLLLCNSLPNNNWKIQAAILDSLVKITERTQFPFCGDDLMVFSTTTLPNLCQCLHNPRYFIVRQKSMSCLNKLTLSLQDHNQLLLCEDSALKELAKSVRLVSDNQLKEVASLILKKLEQ